MDNLTSPAKQTDPATERWRQLVKTQFTESGIAAGLFLGALSGYADILYSGLRRSFAGRMVFLPEVYWWMAPLLNALIVALVTVAAVAGVRLVRGGTAMPGVRFIAAITTAAAGVLVLAPRIHSAAVLALSAGIGFQGGRVLARRAHVADRLTRWGSLALLLAAPAAGPAVFGLPAAKRPASLDGARPVFRTFS
jgi:hypothetical protein